MTKLELPEHWPGDDHLVKAVYVHKWCEFAAAALSGLNAADPTDRWTSRDLTQSASVQADQMLAELKARLTA